MRPKVGHKADLGEGFSIGKSKKETRERGKINVEKSASEVKHWQCDFGNSVNGSLFIVIW